MTTPQPGKMFQSGELYEAYVGRWSRLAAPMFLDWLGLPDGLDWLDLGCGSGVLSGAILARCDPHAVVGIDPSEGMIAHASASIRDARASFTVGDARALPLPDNAVDVVGSALVLNFVPAPEQPTAAAEMCRVVRPGGTVAAYVWDYADRMDMMRHFWDAAIALDPDAVARDEATKFQVCHPEALAALLTNSGLRDVEATMLDVPTVFRDFDDYWQPFMTAQAPAPLYAQGLSPDQQDALRDAVRARLPIAPDGSVSMIARAWAIRGTLF